MYVIKKVLDFHFLPIISVFTSFYVMVQNFFNLINKIGSFSFIKYLKKMLILS